MPHFRNRIVPTFSKSHAPSDGFCQPRFEWHDRGRGVDIEVLVPGVQPGDVDVTVEGREIQVLAHRKPPVLANWQPANLAAALPDYRLRVPLPYDIDADHLRAVLKHGVLTIHLKKSSGRGPRFQAA